MKKFLKILAVPFVFAAALFCSLVASIIVFIAWLILSPALAFEFCRDFLSGSYHIKKFEDENGMTITYTNNPSVDNMNENEKL